MRASRCLLHGRAAVCMSVCMLLPVCSTCALSSWTWPICRQSVTVAHVSTGLLLLQASMFQTLAYLLKRLLVPPLALPTWQQAVCNLGHWCVMLRQLVCTHRMSDFWAYCPDVLWWVHAQSGGNAAVVAPTIASPLPQALLPQILAPPGRTDAWMAGTVHVTCASCSTAPLTSSG